MPQAVNAFHELSNMLQLCEQPICLQFGEIDIDSELVASKESLPDSGDQIMMLNNGCMCCTVKEDLVEMLNDLVNSLAHHTCWLGWKSVGVGVGVGWGALQLHACKVLHHMV